MYNLPKFKPLSTVKVVSKMSQLAEPFPKNKVQFSW